MDNTKKLIQSMQDAGLRLTPQRIAICRSLTNDPNHPTAHMLYEQLRPEYPSLSLTTVYNTLETLVELGVVNPLSHFGEDPTRYDANTSPHAHLLCIKCNRLIDFSSRYVQSLDKEVIEKSGYKILGAYLLYHGICDKCNQEVSKN